MKRVWLIQRLQAPRNVINPFVFGGGIVNGGFGKEGMNLLMNLFSFDYMGAAEFEWGAVPSAFKALAECKDLTTFTISLEGKIPVYGICSESIATDVVKWVTEEMTNPHQLKEPTRLHDIMNYNKYAMENKGWIKVEDDKSCKEPFMFFVDNEMFQNVCKLLGIVIPSIIGQAM